MALCLFSSCSALGRHLWSLFGGFLLCLFWRRLRFSKSYPTAGYPSGVPHPFWLHLPVLFLQWGDVCGVCGVFRAARVFSVLSLALTTAPAVLRSSPYHRLPFGVSCFFLLLPARLLLWWRRLGSRLFPCVLSASPAPAGLPMFGVLHPVLGLYHRVVPSLYMAIWWCLTAPCAFRALFVGLSSLPWLLGGCASGLRVSGPCWLRCLCSLCSLSLLSLLLLCLFVLLRLWWGRLFGRGLLLPPAAPGGCAPLVFLLRLSVPLPSCRTLSWGSSSGVCSGLGWWAAVQCWILPSLGVGGLSFPCPRYFRLAVPTVLLSRLLGFLGLLAGVSLLLLPVFADGSGCLADGPWFSASIAWLQEVLPCFLAVTCRLALLGLR